MSFDGSVSIIENPMVFANMQVTDAQTQETVELCNYQQIPYQPGLTEFNHESIRHLSLLSWFNKNVSKEKLARYGFYYILESNFVKCYFCGVGIGEWGVGDDPLTEHHTHSPECDFINLKPTNNIPIGDKIQLMNELKAIKSINPDWIPRHPDFKKKQTRLQSYINWPKYKRPTPKELSAAGFFYLGSGDGVQCFFCGGCLKDWEDTDIPIQEHKRHFYARCHFIKNNYQKLKRKFSKDYSKNLFKTIRC